MKNIFVLATGGTIAGEGTNPLDTTQYQSGALGIAQLLAQLPQHPTANLTAKDFLAIGSEDMTPALWLKIAHQAELALANPQIDGLVLTHGTDTLEELAYFLHLVLKTHKPVVLVGAMRPATALGSEGGLNLHQAILVASNENAPGKGVLVVMNDTIFAAREVSKQSTFLASAFGGVFGSLGYVSGGRVEFFSQSLRKHTTQTEFFLQDLPAVLPKVEVFYVTAGCDPNLLPALISLGAVGIVVAAFGNGTYSQKVAAQLALVSRQASIVVASRTGSGVLAGEGGFAYAHQLNPQKARVLLMLALCKDKAVAQLQRYFDWY